MKSLSKQLFPLKNKLSLLFLFLLSSCLQDFNSNSDDAKIYGVGAVETALQSSYEILKSKCINCHSGYHSSWANYTTSQMWIDAGLVIAGNSASSLLITKLINYGGNMPLNDAALTIEEVNTLETWINAL